MTNDCVERRKLKTLCKNFHMKVKARWSTDKIFLRQHERTQADLLRNKRVPEHTTVRRAADAPYMHQKENVSKRNELVSF